VPGEVSWISIKSNVFKQIVGQGKQNCRIYYGSQI